MPVHLSKPRAAVEDAIERVLARGRELLQGAEQVATDDEYANWVRATERWHAYGREALHGAYATDKEGDEFYSAATGRIFRQMGQTEAEELEYRRDAIRAGLNTLQSLLERLGLA